MKKGLVVCLAVFLQEISGAEPDVAHVPGSAIVKFSPRDCAALEGKLDAVASELPTAVQRFLPGARSIHRILRDHHIGPELAEISAQCVYEVQFDEKRFQDLNSNLLRSGALLTRNFLSLSQAPPQSSQTRPDDPFFDRQWHLFAMDVMPVWDRVTVGLRTSELSYVTIDTGLDHEDFASNLNVAASRAFVGASPFMDEANHGTPVAGIPCADGNNKLGISGVAQKCNLVVLKTGGIVMFPNGQLGIGFKDTAILAAFYYLLNNVPGALIVSLSYVSANRQERVEEIIDAGKNRMLVFAAAGNDATPENKGLVRRYPCASSIRLTNLVCVAATDIAGGFASFSNRDPGVTDIAAPGVDILTTHSRSITSLNVSLYGFFHGTSGSSPNTAGASYLLWSGLLERGVRIDADVVAKSRKALYEGGFASPSLGTIRLVSAWGAWLLLEQWLLPQPPHSTSWFWGPPRRRR